MFKESPRLCHEDSRACSDITVVLWDFGCDSRSKDPWCILKNDVCGIFRPGETSQRVSVDFPAVPLILSLKHLNTETVTPIKNSSVFTVSVASNCQSSVLTRPE